MKLIGIRSVNNGDHLRNEKRRTICETNPPLNGHDDKRQKHEILKDQVGIAQFRTLGSRLIIASASHPILLIKANELNPGDHQRVTISCGVLT